MSDQPPLLPKEALEFFKRKRLRIGFDYRDVWKAEHDLAFTVAKITELSVLETIRVSIERALEQGQPFDAWRKGLKPELEKQGWWHPREVVDQATGEFGVSRLNNPRRLRTIFEQNTRMAYAAGQWERIERTKATMPYLLRTVGPSVVHREMHLAWHGTLLPVDDPWIQSHPCPSGWGCKCRYRQIGPVEYEKLVSQGVPSPGIQAINPVTGLPTGRKVQKLVPAITKAPREQLKAWKNTRTGVTELLPVGVDPGFNYKPGAAGRKALLDATLRGLSSS